jgi:hypothetical protein
MLEWLYQVQVLRQGQLSLLMEREQAALEPIPLIQVKQYQAQQSLARLVVSMLLVVEEVMTVVMGKTAVLEEELQILAP